MNNKLITLALAMAFTIPVTAQDDDTDVRDPKAKKILDEVSEKTKSYKNIKASFTYSLDNKDEDVHDSQEGEILMKGDKYNLKIAGQEIIYDGKYIWTWLKSADEVQKSLPDENGLSPADMFKIYEEGWKFKYIKKTTENGVELDIIDLVPKKAEKTFSRVRLKIDSKEKRITEAMFFGKDGTFYTYKLKTMATNQDISDSKFSFSPKEHPEVDVIDLTE